jgi:glycosyltransferase involved in cell wall biosynthesis
LIFVGRLVPFKACDIALRGAADLLRAGAAHFTVVGDGSQRGSLEQLVKSLGIENAVSFVGWLGHRETLKALQSSDALVFPSLREIGGGVVFEALTLGAVPVVAEFGGPGDVVTPSVGYTIPIVSEEEMVLTLQSALKELAQDRKHLETDISLWAMGRGPKPTLEPPKRGSVAAPRAVTVNPPSSVTSQSSEQQSSYPQ